MPVFNLKSLFLALALALFGLTAAHAAPDDEAFVRAKAKEALDILADKSLDQSAKTARFRAFVDEISDVRRVARFVLGKYARGADKDKLDEFAKVFRRYSSGVYESQLGNYSGETVTVTGSQDRKPGDSLVSTVISGGKLRDPLTVNWRILTRHGRKIVLDVEVLGIWLALQQRTELSTVIANHGGDIGAAIAVLKDRIARQQADMKAKSAPGDTSPSDSKAPEEAGKGVNKAASDGAVKETPVADKDADTASGPH